MKYYSIRLIVDKFRKISFPIGILTDEGKFYDLTMIHPSPNPYPDKHQDEIKSIINNICDKVQNGKSTDKILSTLANGSFATGPFETKGDADKYTVLSGMLKVVKGR